MLMSFRIPKVAALFGSAGVSILPMCSPEEEESVSEPAPPGFFVEEKFAYPDGKLAGNKAPLGFSGEWQDRMSVTHVYQGVATQSKNRNRCFCLLDTSPVGPFSGYVDELGNIGENGTVLYISYYQELLNAGLDKATIMEFLRGPGHPAQGDVTQFNTGVDIDPSPGGPFGMRVKRSPELSVSAPEPPNDRENLIVLKVEFGFENKDQISYYYNPGIDDEENPVDTVAATDLSIDRVSFGSFQASEMKIRHIRFADNFKAVATDE